MDGFLSSDIIEDEYCVGGSLGGLVRLWVDKVRYSVKEMRWDILLYVN